MKTIASRKTMSYEQIKNEIWNAAISHNENEFERQLASLIGIAECEWFRIGWDINPSSTEELVEILENASKRAHELWVDACKRGDVPGSDVSPGEGFLRCAKIIRMLILKFETFKKWIQIVFGDDSATSELEHEPKDCEIVDNVKENHPKFNVASYGDVIDHWFRDIVLKTHVTADFEITQDAINRMHDSAVKAVYCEISKISKEI